MNLRDNRYSSLHVNALLPIEYIQSYNKMILSYKLGDHATSKYYAALLKKHGWSDPRIKDADYILKNAE
jgi:hypothetical protein